MFLSISVDSSKEQWLKSVSTGTYTSKDRSNVINVYTAGLGDEHPVLHLIKHIKYPAAILFYPGGSYKLTLERSVLGKYQYVDFQK